MFVYVGLSRYRIDDRVYEMSTDEKIQLFEKYEDIVA